MQLREILRKRPAPVAPDPLCAEPVSLEELPELLSRIANAFDEVNQNISGSPWLNKRRGLSGQLDVLVHALAQLYQSNSDVPLEMRGRLAEHTGQARMLYHALVPRVYSGASAKQRAVIDSGVGAMTAETETLLGLLTTHALASQADRLDEAAQDQASNRQAAGEAAPGAQTRDVSSMLSARS